MQQLAPGEFRTTRYNLIYTVPSSAEQDVRPPKCSNVQLFYTLLHVYTAVQSPVTCSALLAPPPSLPSAARTHIYANYCRGGGDCVAELGRAHCFSPSLLFFHPLLVASSRVISALTLRTN